MGVRPARACSGWRRRCRSSLATLATARTGTLIAERMSRDPGPDRRPDRARPRPGARRAGQPDAGRPGRPPDVDPARAGQPQPQHPVRGHDAARPGRRDLPAAADGLDACLRWKALSRRMTMTSDRRSWCWRTGARSAARRTARGGDLRRGGLHHRDDRLPGDADRPVLPPAGRGADRAAHRQHRRQRRGRRVATGSGSPVTWSATRPGRARTGGPPAAWRTAGRRGRGRHQRHRHPGADPAPARARRDAGRHLQRRARPAGAAASGCRQRRRCSARTCPPR